MAEPVKMEQQAAPCSETPETSATTTTPAATEAPVRERRAGEAPVKNECVQPSVSAVIDCTA
jgi:hypothetical protein